MRILNLIRLYDIEAVESFGEGFAAAAEYLEQNIERKQYDRSVEEWLQEETSELLEAVSEGDLIHICHELGDVVYVTCGIICRKFNMSMCTALTQFMKYAGEKWLRPRF